jgi:hypothetical protein
VEARRPAGTCSSDGTAWTGVGARHSSINGDELSLTRQRVHQIEQISTKRLRAIMIEQGYGSQ